jgi:hypothetical protein
MATKETKKKVVPRKTSQIYRTTAKPVQRVMFTIVPMETKELEQWQQEFLTVNLQ